MTSILVHLYYVMFSDFLADPASVNNVAAYLIFVTGITGGACVKKSVRCKIFQIERKKMHILDFLRLLLVIFGFKILGLKNSACVK